MTIRKKNRAGVKRPSREGDSGAAHELELFVENDSALYHQQHQPILKNLANKKAQGKYDHDKAVKLFMYLMESGAKKYAAEFGGVWNQMFDVPTRKIAAEKFARSFEVEYRTGAYDNYLTKVSAKAKAANPNHAGAPKDKRISCPFCKVKTWNTDYVQFMSDHDRPDGRKCLRAAESVGTANRTGRTGKARKTTLKSISVSRRPAVVLVTEQPDKELGGTRMDFVISQPGAKAIADRLQSLGGSYWETDGSDFAYNIVTVFSDEERSSVLDELRNDGVKIEFADYGVPRGYESRVGVAAAKREARAARAAKRGQKRPSRAKSPFIRY